MKDMAGPDIHRAPFGVGSDAETTGAPSGIGSLITGLYGYLDDLSKRAFQSSGQTSWDRSERVPYDPGPILEAAMLPMGTGAFAGVPMRGKEAVLGAGPIRAYHSSPHDFDKFDLAKVGTGEGAQVYGHGLYFAENPAVSGQGGQYWDSFLRRFEGTPEGAAASRLRSQQFSREHAINSTRRDYEDWATGAVRNVDPAYAEKMLKLRQEELRLLESGAPVGPRTYEVGINAKPEQLLDWDKPLMTQPQGVQERAYSLLPRARTYPEMKGSSFYENLVQAERGDDVLRLGQERASNLLNAMDIPGMRYLDQGSRGARQAIEPSSYNYVMFDPGLVDILKKYGIAAPVAAPAASSVFSSAFDEPR